MKYQQEFESKTFALRLHESYYENYINILFKHPIATII